MRNHGKQRRQADRAVALLATLVAVVLLAGSGRAAANDPLMLDVMILSKSVPEFELPPVRAGDPGLSDDDLLGKVSLVNVWASWCPPCREEHPVLMDLASRDLAPIYGLNFKDGAANASSWLDGYGNPYARNGFDADGGVAAAFGLFGLPQTFVVDPAGRIAYVHRGPLKEEDIERIIVPLIERLSSP